MDIITIVERLSSQLSWGTDVSALSKLMEDVNSGRSPSTKIYTTRLYSIRSGLSACCDILSGSDDDRSAEELGCFLPILSITTRLTDTLLNLSKPAPHDCYEPLPKPLLFNCISLGFECLNHSLPYAILPRRFHRQLLRTAIVAYMQLPISPSDVHTNNLQSNVISLLSSLTNPSIYSPTSISFTLRCIVNHVAEYPVTTVEAPGIVFNLLREVILSSSSNPESRHWPRYLTPSIPNITRLLSVVSSDLRVGAAIFLDKIDDERVGLLHEVHIAECTLLKAACLMVSNGADEPLKMELSWRLIDDRCSFLSRTFDEELLASQDTSDLIAGSIAALLGAGIHLASVSNLVAAFEPPHIRFPSLITSCLMVLLSESHISTLPLSMTLQACSALFAVTKPPQVDVPRVVTELGKCMSRIALHDEGAYQFEGREGFAVAEASLSLLSWAAESSLRPEDNQPVMHGINESGVAKLREIFEMSLSHTEASKLEALQKQFTFEESDQTMEDPVQYTQIPQGSLLASFNDLQKAIHSNLAQGSVTPPDGRPVTPPHSSVGVVAAMMSPPILRSPTITGPTLHKKYSAHDFRSSHVSPTSASRPPSTHVDVSSCDISWSVLSDSLKMIRSK